MNIVTGYDKVLNTLTDITETLKLNSDSKDKLTRLYQQEKWLGIAATPGEDELVKLALKRIEQDPSQFGLFVDMLHETEGMDLIVTTLTGGELRCGHCTEMEHLNTNIPDTHAWALLACPHSCSVYTWTL